MQIDMDKDTYDLIVLLGAFASIITLPLLVWHVFFS